MVLLVIREKELPISKEKKYYAGLAPLRGFLDAEAVSEKISEETTLTRADVTAVVTALEEAIYTHLVQGHSVRLKKLGSFRPVLKGTPSLDKEKAGANAIRSVRVVFRPSGRILAEIKRRAKVEVVG